MPDFRFCSKVISIHALREEGDLDTVHKLTDTIKFLSTPSARRATRRLSQGRSGCCISIHALREEGDTRPPSCSRFLPAFLSTPSARRATPRCRTAAHSPWYFYPRPPRGGRLAGNRFMVARKGFLSTPSARRATQGHPAGRNPREFLSTPSARRATQGHPAGRNPREFLSTPSARRATGRPHRR